MAAADVKKLNVGEMNFSEKYLWGKMYGSSEERGSAMSNGDRQAAGGGSRRESIAMVWICRENGERASG